jgi:AcrR family transcriptional regulator
MESKHAQRSKATRDKLVAAARGLFGARGYAAVGTEEIVRAAGVTRGALYHQFRDKEDLFAAVFEQLEAETTARVADGALGDGAPAADPLAAPGRPAVPGRVRGAGGRAHPPARRARRARLGALA